MTFLRFSDDMVQAATALLLVRLSLLASAVRASIVYRSEWSDPSLPVMCRLVNVSTLHITWGE
jgi:hypothetical protein